MVSVFHLSRLTLSPTLLLSSSSLSTGIAPLLYSTFSFAKSEAFFSMKSLISGYCPNFQSQMTSRADSNNCNQNKQRHVIICDQNTHTGLQPNSP